MINGDKEEPRFSGDLSNGDDLNTCIDVIRVVGNSSVGDGMWEC